VASRRRRAAENGRFFWPEEHSLGAPTSTGALRMLLRLCDGQYFEGVLQAAE
jgi:hypothetical protein